MQGLSSCVPQPAAERPSPIVYPTAFEGAAIGVFELVFHNASNVVQSTVGPLFKTVATVYGSVAARPANRGQ
jgi:hypothetical protein